VWEEADSSTLICGRPRTSRTTSRPSCSSQPNTQHNGGIRRREIVQNKVFICCSKPLSDITIDA